MAMTVAPVRRASAGAPQMEIVPASGLQDSPLRIRLSGLPPSSRVAVVAVTTARDGVLWRSRAAFQADDAGNVDVGSSRPVDGTYQIPSAMGLVWSMARESAPTVALKRLRDPVDITLSATTETDGLL